jgi:3-hydroxymyristoyl/3-hydroxydecanoyl-(acyl carrier protein) dehydratase
LTDLINISPEIISKEKQDTEATVELFIPDNLDYFKGHFPQSPILPGVVQLDWAVMHAKHMFNIDCDVKDIEVLKFQVVIEPGQNLTLQLAQKSEQKVTFSYSSNKGKHASGRIVFDTLS